MSLNVILNKRTKEQKNKRTKETKRTKRFEIEIEIEIDPPAQEQFSVDFRGFYLSTPFLKLILSASHSVSE